MSMTKRNQDLIMIHDVVVMDGVAIRIALMPGLLDAAEKPRKWTRTAAVATVDVVTLTVLMPTLLDVAKY